MGTPAPKESHRAPPIADNILYNSKEYITITTTTLSPAVHTYYGAAPCERVLYEDGAADRGGRFPWKPIRSSTLLAPADLELPPACSGAAVSPAVARASCATCTHTRGAMLRSESSRCATPITLRCGEHELHLQAPETRRPCRIRISHIHYTPDTPRCRPP